MQLFQSYVQCDINRPSQEDILGYVVYNDLDNENLNYDDLGVFPDNHRRIIHNNNLVIEAEAAIHPG